MSTTTFDKFLYLETLKAAGVPEGQGGSVAGFDPAICNAAGLMAWGDRDTFQSAAGIGRHGL